MLDINDLNFRKLVEHGIPLERLEARLRPRLRLKDRDEEIKAHDGFGNFSDDGFLGARENLLEVIHADWLVVEHFGTTHQKTAIALEKAITKRKMPNPKYCIETVFCSCGVQGCPWYCTSKYEPASDVIFIYHQEIHKEDIRVMENLFFSEFASKEDPLIPYRIRKAHENRHFLRERFGVVTQMHPHLIGEHYFFEGLESPYRADPVVLIKALGIEGQS